jgi:NO-binding membrane sensor protein with MHYT domain/nitrogen-specific signal transduction histidine kinase
MFTGAPSQCVMYRLFSCITEQHDLRLVALAGLICLFACYTGLDLLARARDLVRGRSLAWSWAAAIVFGSGIWATHFVAELAYLPGFPIGYDVGLTALSFAAAIVLTWLGMRIVLHCGAALLGGSMVGAAAGTMHYIGMAALRAPAEMHWSPAYVLASIVIAIGLAAPAMRVLVTISSVWGRSSAALLLVLAIVGLHFTGMAAIVLEPNPVIAVPDAVVNPDLLAFAVAAVTIVIILLGISGMLVDNRLAWQAAREAAHLRESEARLRHSERHLARAQALAEIGSFEWNRETGTVTWSDNLYAIYGVKQGAFEITRENVLALVHPDDRARVADADRASAVGDIASAFEYRVVRPSGECRYVVAEREAIRDDRGALIGLFGTVRDVSVTKAAEAHKRELESQLQHSQRLEALGTLAGGIAHDLNNTMVPVVALSKLLTKHFPPESREFKNLQTISSAGAHARDLVQQILAFSRKNTPSRRSADLALLMREMQPMLRALVPATIRIEASISAVPTIFADAGQIHQVVMNLVVNAAQAIGSAMGTITIVLAAEPDLRRGPSDVGTPADRMIHLSVRDTGCGMDETTQAHIFEPFFTTKNVGEGTGLGLAVVHGVVTEHGGRVTVESRIAAGTCFHVYLPVPSAAAKAQHPNAAA